MSSDNVTDLVPYDAICRAIERAGGPSALARALSIAMDREVLHSTVIKWRSNGRLPPKYVLHIEELTGVSRYSLCPKVFGAAPEPRVAA
ncbi:MAG: YdaS family helix-turn-helix protein [Thiohalocapsa sp.]